MSAIVYELNPLTHWKSLGVKNSFEIFEVLKFLESKNFTCDDRDIYSESTLHQEQEYIGIDLIL
jgi:hypothetical protein